MPHVHESTAIDTPADEVWSLAGDLGRISEWHPAVAASEASAGDPSEVDQVTAAMSDNYRVALEALRRRFESRPT